MGRTGDLRAEPCTDSHSIAKILPFSSSSLLSPCRLSCSPSFPLLPRSSFFPFLSSSCPKSATQQPVNDSRQIFSHQTVSPSPKLALREDLGDRRAGHLMWNVHAANGHFSQGKSVTCSPSPSLVRRPGEHEHNLLLLGNQLPKAGAWPRTNPAASPQRLVGCLMRLGVNEAYLDDACSKQHCCTELITPGITLPQGVPHFFQVASGGNNPRQTKAIAVTSKSTDIQLACMSCPSWPPLPSAVD